MAVVFGRLPDKARADQAVDELRRGSDARPSFPVQTHDRNPLDGNYLPESATEIGRNTAVAIGFGAVGGTLLGAAAGALLDIVGLTTAMGAIFGLLTGVLSGMLGGMMAGTRRPKLALREVAEGLGEGRVLVTVEVEDARHVDIVETVLESAGADSIGSC